MPELYLKQPGLTYTAWGSFNKYWERIQKFREIGNLKHLFNKWIKQSLFSSWCSIFW